MTARPRDADALDVAPLSVGLARLSRPLAAVSQRDAGAGDPADGAGHPARPLHATVLTPEQRAYAQARAEGQNKRQACASAGVVHRTMYYWYDRPELAAAIDGLIEELSRARLAEARRLAVAALPIALARLRHIARRGSEGEARKASEYLVDLAGVRAPTPHAQHAAGPRIFVERAVLALGNPQGTDGGTPADRG